MENLVVFTSAELGEKNSVIGMFTVDVVDDKGGCCVDLLRNEFAQEGAKRVEGGSWFRAGRAGTAMSVKVGT